MFAINIFSSILSKIETSVLLKNINHKNENRKFLWLDKTFVSYYLISIMALNQNGKFLVKSSISCYLTLFMASKTKMESFHNFIRTLFLAFFLRFWFQNQNGTFLCLDKKFSYFFAWFMAIKFETGIFWDLIKLCF